MDTRQERTHQDAKQWNSQIGRIYYHRCEDDPRWYRTTRLVRNPFNGNLNPQVSNAVYGEPPPELEPIPPLLKNRLFSMANELPY